MGIGIMEQPVSGVVLRRNRVNIPRSNGRIVMIERQCRISFLDD